MNEMVYVSEFGAALKRRRLARGISQSKLALDAGFDHSYISRTEAGERNPTYSAVLAMALPLGRTGTLTQTRQNHAGRAEGTNQDE